MAKSFVEVHYDTEEGFILRLRPEELTLIPEPTRKHVKGAGRELLLAMRSVLDSAIERVEKSEEKKPTRRRKIKIED